MNIFCSARSLKQRINQKWKTLLYLQLDQLLYYYYHYHLDLNAAFMCSHIRAGLFATRRSKMGRTWAVAAAYGVGCCRCEPMQRSGAPSLKRPQLVAMATVPDTTRKHRKLQEGGHTKLFDWLIDWLIFSNLAKQFLPIYDSLCMVSMVLALSEILKALLQMMDRYIHTLFIPEGDLRCVHVTRKASSSLADWQMIQG